MINTPFFTVIIPSYNAERFIKKALDSVLSQSFTDLELLVIDAQSTDATLAIVKEKNDERISVMSEPDKGTYDAMNKGIHLAKGEWLYFMGSDDSLLDGDVLRNVYEFIIASNANVVYGNVLIEGDTLWAKDGETYAGKFNARKLYKKNICHQSIFYKNSFLKENGISYNLNYPVNADWDFNFACWSHSRFTYLPRTIARFSAGGLSTRKDAEPVFAAVRSKHMPFSQKLINKIDKFRRIFFRRQLKNY